MNILVCNSALLNGVYLNEGMPIPEKQKDQEVARLLQRLYPGRIMVSINPYAINRGGGGLHCATSQYLNKLLARHN